MMGSMDTYKTPEGFDLYKPLIFPNVRDFTELLTVEGPWDFATMNHKSGYAQPTTPKDIGRGGFETDKSGSFFATSNADRTVGRFCSTRNLPGRGSLFVTPTDMLLRRIFADESESLDFAFFDHVSFEAIYHESNDRVLVVASASGILASRWLAYVDPATVPSFA